MMEGVESQVLEYVKRFPFNSRDFYAERLIHNQRLMTQAEFEQAFNDLIAAGELYQPRPGYFEPKRGREVGASSGLREIVPMKKKPKIPKSHVKLTVRREIEGYVCHNCGKWVQRAWDKPRLRKCPKCGKKTWRFGRPVLQRAYKHTEKRTKHWKMIFEPILGRKRGPINKERVSVPGISAAALPMPKPKEEAVRVIVTPKKRLTGYRGQHVKRDRNSPDFQRVQAQAHQAQWATIRNRNKQKPIGYYTDRKTGKKRPIFAKTRHARKLIQQQKKKRFSVKPRKKKVQKKKKTKVRQRRHGKN